MMIDLSGRTTAYEHKRKDWKEHGLNIGKECIEQVYFFDAQWSNCPVEVEAAVKQLWTNWELGNDHYFLEWSWEFETDEYLEAGKIVADFLRSKGFDEDDGKRILIHWWW